MLNLNWNDEKEQAREKLIARAVRLLDRRGLVHFLTEFDGVETFYHFTDRDFREVAFTSSKLIQKAKRIKK